MRGWPTTSPCTGARPVAVTDCLNYGNPERLDVYYQLEQSVRGMAAACETLGVPVVSGNVSLFNESYGTAIYPTPVVGALGVLEDASKIVPMGFVAAGDAVYLIGATAEGEPETAISLVGRPEELAGSEYLRQFHGLVVGQPRIDLGLEARVQNVLVEAADLRRLRSAHDCSHGGLAVALAEACFANNVGFVSEGIALNGRVDAALFGEAASRVVVSVQPEQAAAFEGLLNLEEVPFLRLGTVGGDRLRVAGQIDESIEVLRTTWEGGLEAHIVCKAGLCQCDREAAMRAIVR